MLEKREIFDEFEVHLLEDGKPSDYFNEKLETGIFSTKYPFTLLGDLISTGQSPEHHPEGSVWNHTMLVVDNAAKRKHESCDPRVFMWGALLHDLGKAPTTRVRKGKVTSYDHDRVGEKLSIDFLREFTDDDEFMVKVSALVRWHMQILFVVKGLPFADIGKMLSEVPLEEIALLGICDRLGRGKLTPEKIAQEKESVEFFVKKCKAYKQA